MTSNAASAPPAEIAPEEPAAPEAAGSVDTEDAPVPAQTTAAGAADSVATGQATTTGTRSAERDLAVVPEPGPDPAGLHERASEARRLLTPEKPVIPAPRSPQGVTVPATFGRGGDQPSVEVVKTTDQLVADLATVREKPDEPAHVVLVRLGELTAAGIPDAGWSHAEQLEPDVITEAAALADELHTSTVALLERLDGEKLASSAVVVSGMATSLQVMKMVADLEVFARSRA